MLDSVSQNWGGKGWGGMFIPHVGQEVIVHFLEGDPDMPLITGRVYNAENMPPVALPAGKTQSIIKDHGANHIIMEGDEGKQRISMFSPHSNTRFNMGAPNSPAAGFFFKTDQQWNEFVNANSRQIDEKGNVEIKTQGNSHSHTVGNVDASVLGDSNYYLKGNYICQVDGYQEYSTVGHYVTKVLGYNWVVIAGADTDIYLSAQQALNVGTHLNVYGNVRYQIDKALDVFKTPYEKYLAAKEKTQVGESMQQFGELREKVAGELRSEASSLRHDAGKMSLISKGLAKLKAATMEVKASKLQWEADKLEAKGTKKFTKGELKVNNCTQMPDLKRTPACA